VVPSDGLQLIFIAPPGAPTTAPFQSLSVPLLSILSASYEQPMFGANYISFEIKPSPEGGLTNGTIAEIRLGDRGILQFWEQLQKPRERAIYERRSKALEQEDEGLRACFFMSVYFGLLNS
jgi:WW domain-binding protein 2